MKNFYFGINTHNRNYDAYPEKNLQEHIRLSKELGMNMIRFNYNPNNEDEYAYLDKIVELCAKENIELMLVLDGFSPDITEEEYALQHSKIARRYKGKIKYYQIFNELDVYSMHMENWEIYKGGDGKKLDEYFPDRLSKTAPVIRSSVKAFRENDPTAKLVVNFCWWHTAFIEYLTESGCEWDITGCDWYSDAEMKSSMVEVFKWLVDKFPKREILICETNWWANSGSENDSERDKLQAEWSAKFIDTIYNCDIPNVKGIIFYELLDEPCFEIDKGSYHGESHFGFVKCNRYGDEMMPKLVYYAVKDVLAQINNKHIL